MRGRTYTSEGIVLARKNYGEADRILSVYTKDGGRVSLMAKGVRRPKSKKRGHIEAFSYLRFQAVSGHGIDLMTEAQVIEDFKEIRRSLKKISVAYYLAEVVGRITHEGETNVSLFNMVLRNLKKLKVEKELKKLRLSFVSELLVLLGYWPGGDKLRDPDRVLEDVIERQLFSHRVGRIMSS